MACMPSLVNATIGEYRLVEFLGAGGMGEVYRAVHTQLGRTVAIKILSEPHDRSLLLRSYNEAQIQSSLQHPGIAAFYGFYEYDGRPCILMEYVGGESLAERIRRQGALEIPEALHILEHVSAAVAHVHRQGIIHRDLKPSNIKLTPAGEIKVLDFGIAKAPHSARVTKVGAVVGTSDSLAPEQIAGGEADTRSDVWALGVLLYEMLTGQLPFQDRTLPELYRKICAVEYVHASVLNPALPPALERILESCLRKDPKQRYPTAAELHDAVVVSSTPALRPVGRDRRGLWMGGAVATVAMLVLVVWAAISPPSRPGKNLKTITVDVVSGSADVYRNGKRIGSTPLQLSAPIGERVDLQLKRPGFEDMTVEFDVSERSSYSYTMQPPRN